MQLLIDQGWTNYYSCMCGGSLKQYWIHESYPSYEIRLRPTKNVFSILNKNNIIHGPDWIYKMEEKLKAFSLYQ